MKAWCLKKKKSFVFHFPPNVHRPKMQGESGPVCVICRRLFCNRVMPGGLHFTRRRVAGWCSTKHRPGSACARWAVHLRSGHFRWVLPQEKYILAKRPWLQHTEGWILATSLSFVFWTLIKVPLLLLTKSKVLPCLADSGALVRPPPSPYTLE